MSLTFIFWNNFPIGKRWLLFWYGQHLLFESAILHAYMEAEKLLWNWILKTLLCDDNFDVKKIEHLIPPPNLIKKQKIKSMLEGLSPIIMFGSWISCSSPS